MKANVPIEAKRTKSKRGGLTPSMIYSNEATAKFKRARLDACEKCNREEIIALAAKFNSDFHTLPEVRRDSYKDEAEARRDRPDRDEPVEASKYNSARRWGLCSEDEPLPVDSLLEMTNVLPCFIR